MGCYINHLFFTVYYSEFEHFQSLQKDFQSQVKELQQQVLSKEAQLIRGEEINCREHQQIQEMVSLMILLILDVVILYLFQRETIRKDHQVMQEMRQQVRPQVHVSSCESRKVKCDCR